MDVDSRKPVYAFLLDFSGKCASVSDLPGDLLSQCCHLAGTTGEKEPDIAVRGSTPAFGSWGPNGLRATKLSAGCYAFLVNDHLTEETQYKWLNMNGVSITGDCDPATGFHYEPDPFVDRTTRDVEAIPGEIVFVFNTWGKYSNQIFKECIDKWIPDTVTTTDVSKECKKPGVSSSTLDDTTSSSTLVPETEEDEKSKDSLFGVPDASSITASSHDEIATTVDIVNKHYEVQASEKDELKETEKSEKYEVETSEKEYTATVDMSNDDADKILTAGDTEHGILCKDGPEMAFSTQDCQYQDGSLRAVGNANNEETIEIDLANKDIELAKKMAEMPESSEVSVPGVEETALQDKRDKSVTDESFMASEEIEMTITTTTMSSTPPAENTPDLASQYIEGKKEMPEREISETGKQNAVEPECTDDLAEDDQGINLESSEVPGPDFEDTALEGKIDKSETDKTSMASEQIDTTITATTTMTSKSPEEKTTDQSPDQDAVNNNTDVSNDNESFIEKVNTSSVESSTTESVFESISEATFKRMSRISETDAPEIDQVNETMMCTELTKITVPNAQRLPSSSSC